MEINNQPESPTQYIDNNQEYDEEIEDDLYLLALQKRLAAMKKDRKKAEQDANLLKNRLNLLKAKRIKYNTIIIL